MESKKKMQFKKRKIGDSEYQYEPSNIDDSPSQIAQEYPDTQAKQDDKLQNSAKLMDEKESLEEREAKPLSMDYEESEEPPVEVGKGHFGAKSRLDAGKKPQSLLAPRQKGSVNLKNCDHITLFLPEVPKNPFVAFDNKDAYGGQRREDRLIEDIFPEDYAIKDGVSAENYYKIFDKKYDERRKNAITEIQDEIKKLDKNDSHYEEQLELKEKQIKQIEEHTPQWLHTIANSLGSPLRKFNISSGTFAANTQMEVIENAIAAELGIGVEVTVYHQKDTYLAEWYTYKIYAQGADQYLVFEIDGRREWYNDEDYQRDKKLLDQFIEETAKAREKFEPPEGMLIPEVKEAVCVDASKTKTKYPKEGRKPTAKHAKTLDNNRKLFEFDNTEAGSSPQTEDMYNDIAKAAHDENRKIKNYKADFSKFTPWNPKSHNSQLSSEATQVISQSHLKKLLLKPKSKDNSDSATQDLEATQKMNKEELAAAMKKSAKDESKDSSDSATQDLEATQKMEIEELKSPIKKNAKDEESSDIEVDDSKFNAQGFFSGLKNINKTPLQISVEKIDQNRSEYKKILKEQQQIIEALQEKGIKVTDYQILTQFNKQSMGDDKEITKLKGSAYKLTKQLIQLEGEYTALEKKIQKETYGNKPQANKNQKHAVYKDKKLSFTEKPITGDGWCTLRAIGIDNPAKELQVLKKQLDNPVVVNYIRRAIENNYQASISLKEPFAIKGKDNNGHVIADRIKALYEACQKSENGAQKAQEEFMDYLERPEVQTAYLEYLVISQYADVNIAQAFLVSSNKKIALFIDYNLPDGKLVNVVADEVDPTAPNVVCLVYHPNATSSSAHYNVLIPDKNFQPGLADRKEAHPIQLKPELKSNENIAKNDVSINAKKNEKEDSMNIEDEVPLINKKKMLGHKAQLNIAPQAMDLESTSKSINPLSMQEPESEKKTERNS